MFKGLQGQQKLPLYTSFSLALYHRRPSEHWDHHGSVQNPQTREADRIEQMLQGGCDTEVESESDDSPSDDEDSIGLPQRTGTGRSATRLRL